MSNGRPLPTRIISLHHAFDNGLQMTGADIRQAIGAAVRVG